MSRRSILGLLFFWGALISCRSLIFYQRWAEGTKFSTPYSMGILENVEIDEASGLVASQTLPGYFWTHNDSQDIPRIFLLNEQGQGTIEFQLSGIKNRDWEEISRYNYQGVSHLYLGDIGDNLAQYPSYFIHRFKEPQATALEGERIIHNIESLEFKLPDGARDMEAMLIDQWNGDIYLISKRDDIKRLYRLPQSAFLQTGPAMAEFICHLNFSKPKVGLNALKAASYISGASVSAGNDEVLVRNYLEFFYWKKSPKESLASCLQRPPVIVPSKLEPQGEAIAFALDQQSYVSLSEWPNKTQALHLFGVKKLRDNHQLSKTQQ